jgi:hypothetical protein
VPIVETKEVPIQWDGREEKVVIKKLRFGEKMDLDQESSDVRMVGTVKQAIVKPGTYALLAVLKSLVTAPFKIDIQSVRDLPDDIGFKIYEEVEKFSNLSNEKKDS